MTDVRDIVEHGPAVSGDGPTWTGVLDLDRPSASIVATGSELSDEHILARVLVRWHGAPVGYVSVQPEPSGSLTARTRAVAQETFAPVLEGHAHCGQGPGADGLQRGWAQMTGCPLNFPAAEDVGVTIAIATRNRAQGLRDCLSKIQQISYEPLEILVVDNAPSDSTTKDLVAALARDDPRLTYTQEPGRGASRARNLALASARYEIVALTDDDVLVDNGWVSALAAGFLADPEVTCVTGLVAPSALDNPFQRYFEYRYPHQGAFTPARYDMHRHSQPSRLYPFAAGLFGRGANMAVRRSAALRAGGFDPLLGAGAICLGGEDLDLFVRMLLDGGRICYMPSAVIWHRHRENADALNYAVYVYGYGLGAYLSKHLSHPRLRHGLLTEALHLPGPQAARMKKASQSSQLGARSARLAAAETYGLLAGMLGYRIRSWQHARALRQDEHDG
jgi:glycosyltransferase involved in cell wall biosynthesis